MNKTKLVMMSAVVMIAIVLVVVYGKSIFTGNVISEDYQPAPRCDPTLWWHVWNASRLEIVDKCISVTGTVISSFRVNDGDQHIQLLPDKQYLHLLNANNIKFQLGSLVIEPICSHDPANTDNATVLDAAVGLAEGKIEEGSIEACRGYARDIEVYDPKVGEHVRVTGPYVLDTLHGWMEIHPVDKIELIK